MLWGCFELHARAAVWRQLKEAIVYWSPRVTSQVAERTRDSKKYCLSWELKIHTVVWFYVVIFLLIHHIAERLRIQSEVMNTQITDTYTNLIAVNSLDYGEVDQLLLSLCLSCIGSTHQLFLPHGILCFKREISCKTFMIFLQPWTSLTKMWSEEADSKFSRGVCHVLNFLSEKVWNKEMLYIFCFLNSRYIVPQGTLKKIRRHWN